MFGLGSKRSVIRDLFEFGKQRAAQVGADKVFDFSLGNPSVPAPENVREAIRSLIDEPDSTALHGYTSAPGDIQVRQAIAADINARFGAGIGAEDIYMTCGAAASLCITFRALNSDSDEFIALAPYFPEYKVFITAAGARIKSVRFREEDFQPDLEALGKAIGPATKGVVVNSPNNPCGVVYTPETLEAICTILREKEAEYGHPIYLICDEPYREIVYGDVQVPYIMNMYDDSIVCYSFSKSLSLPGERIGYIAVCPRAASAHEIYAAICGAGRALGYVCAPSLFQKVVGKVVGTQPDIAAYARNRDLLFNSLEEIGYKCVRPDGAFYLFVKALESDAGAFSQKAKEFGLLLVPGDDFEAPGYVRIAYCVSYEMIKRSMPAFRALFECYRG